MYQLFDDLKQAKEKTTCCYKSGRHSDPQAFQNNGRFKDIMRVAFLAYTYFDAPAVDGNYYGEERYPQPVSTQLDAFCMLDKKRWEHVLINQKMDDKCRLILELALNEAEATCW